MFTMVTSVALPTGQSKVLVKAPRTVTFINLIQLEMNELFSVTALATYQSSV
jgi:hypothetical protein